MLVGEAAGHSFEYVESRRSRSLGGLLDGLDQKSRGHQARRAKLARLRRARSEADLHRISLVARTRGVPPPDGQHRCNSRPEATTHPWRRANSRLTWLIISPPVAAGRSGAGARAPQLAAQTCARRLRTRSAARPRLRACRTPTAPGEDGRSRRPRQQGRRSSVAPAGRSHCLAPRAGRSAMCPSACATSETGTRAGGGVSGAGREAATRGRGRSATRGRRNTRRPRAAERARRRRRPTRTAEPAPRRGAGAGG